MRNSLPHIYSVLLLLYGFIRLIGVAFNISSLLVWEEVLLGILVICTIFLLMVSERTNSHPRTDQWTGFYIWFGVIGVMGVSMILSPLSIGWSQWAIPIIFLLLMTLFYGIYIHQDKVYQREVFERKGYLEVRRILALKVLSFSMWFFVLLLWLHLGAFGLFLSSVLSYEINIFIVLVTLLGSLFIAVYPYWEWRMEEKIETKHTIIDEFSQSTKDQIWKYISVVSWIGLLLLFVIRHFF